MTKKEKTTYYHSIMAATLVKPGSGVVLPLRHEFIRAGMEWAASSGIPVYMGKRDRKPCRWGVVEGQLPVF
jgi:hypothetical protein